MNHSPADIVRYLLINKGTGTLPTSSGSWPIHAESEPSAPDNCITIYTTDGNDDGSTMVDGKQQGAQGIQVRIRSADHATGWVKADTIHTKFEEGYQDTVTISTSSYFVHCVSRIGDVIPLGSDAPNSKRKLFTINAVVNIREL